MSLDAIIQARRSIRKYKNKKPDWRDIIECIDSMRYAPMAGGNFTLKFILVSDKDKIKKITESAQQEFIGTAEYLVVVCSNSSRTVNAYGEKGHNYVRQQAGAAIQNFLLKLTEKKLATCWIGYFVESMVKEVLKIPKETQVEAIFPIGYPNEKKYTKEKVDLDNALYFDEYGHKQMKKNKSIDA
jgi:nitroreductase